MVITVAQNAAHVLLFVPFWQNNVIHEITMPANSVISKTDFPMDINHIAIHSTIKLPANVIKAVPPRSPPTNTIHNIKIIPRNLIILYYFLLRIFSSTMM